MKMPLLIAAASAGLLFPAGATASESPPIDGPTAPAASSEDPIERPPSGVGFVLAGGLLGAASGGAYFGALACLGEPAETECLVATVAIGSAALVASIPLLIVGLQRNADLVRWRESRIELLPSPDGAAVRWRLSF